MIRGCDWVGFFLLAFALTTLFVALPPWLLLLSLVNLFYAKETSTHLLHFSDMVSFLDSAITCVIALICGIVLLWVVSGKCRAVARTDRRKKEEKKDRTD